MGLARVMIAWNDTREARRAIVDALPILRQASHVSVATVVNEDLIADGREQVSRVARWLGQHGVAAHKLVAPSNGTDAARLEQLADEDGAELVVAGAYGTAGFGNGR